jgi:hypothetical protein
MISFASVCRSGLREDAYPGFPAAFEVTTACVVALTQSKGGEMLPGLRLLL